MRMEAALHDCDTLKSCCAGGAGAPWKGGEMIKLCLGLSRGIDAMNERIAVAAEWLVLLGASYTLKKNEHVRVDIVYGNVSARRQIGIDIFGSILFLLPATLIMAYLSWPVFYNSWSQGEISANAGGLIRWPVKLLLPVGFALLSLQGISELIKRIAMLSGHMQADLHYERPLQ